MERVNENVCELLLERSPPRGVLKIDLLRPLPLEEFEELRRLDGEGEREVLRVVIRLPLPCPDEVCDARPELRDHGCVVGHGSRSAPRYFSLWGASLTDTVHRARELESPIVERERVRLYAGNRHRNSLRLFARYSAPPYWL